MDFELFLTMDNNQQISKKNEYKLKKERRENDQLARRHSENIKKFFKIFILILVIVILSGFLWLKFGKSYNNEKSNIDDQEIISRKGLHWHSDLEIYIKDTKQEIPANIGIGITHNPIHTHDTTGKIHLEFSGLVKNGDLKLGKFFEVWGKQFNSNCIFDHCNGSDGQVKMFVNETENNEFENYQMKDGDKIKILF